MVTKSRFLDSIVAFTEARNCEGGGFTKVQVICHTQVLMN